MSSPAKKSEAGRRAAIGYVRVSTGRQARKGVSLAAQRKLIAQYAAAHGLRAGEIFGDPGKTGRRLDRPGLRRAIGAAKKERGVLVCYALNRVARNTRGLIDLAEELRAAGVDLVSISEKIDTTTAMGRFFFRLMASLAEFESDLLGERIVDALAYKRGQSRRWSGGKTPPFGYVERGGLVYRDAAEQRLLRVIRRRRNDLKWSYRKIAAWLTSRGAKPKRGKTWQPAVIRRILRGRALAKAPNRR